MVLITAGAQAQLGALEQHYASLGRERAIEQLVDALSSAAARIEAQAGPFLPSPRPYPQLSDYGWRWLKQARYWFAFATIEEAYVITGVFFESADIPKRL